MIIDLSSRKHKFYGAEDYAIELDPMNYKKYLEEQVDAISLKLSNGPMRDIRHLTPYDSYSLEAELKDLKSKYRILMGYKG